MLITGVLGYIRARDALEETIYNQLTAARQTKARQVESYFRTIRNELRLLASFQDGGRCDTRVSFDVQRTRAEPMPDELRRQASSDWYGQNFLPIVRRLLGKDVPLADYLPVGSRRHVPAVPLHRRQPAAVLAAQAGRRRRRRQRLQRRPCHLPSADAHRGVDARLLRFHDGRPEIRPHSSMRWTRKSISRRRCRSGPYRHSNLAAAVARCAGTPDPSPTCLEDFAPYLPSDGQPIAFMAAPVIDQGVVIGVLIAQLSIEEIDNVVTGDRRWRQEGFGDTGEAYLVGPDFFVRSGPRLFFEDRDAIFAELKDSRRPARRASTPSAATARRCCISASTPRRRRAALGGRRRAPARSSAIAACRRSLPGGRSGFPA